MDLPFECFLFHQKNTALVSSERRVFKDSTPGTNQSQSKTFFTPGSGSETSRSPIWFKSKAFERYAHFVFQNVQNFNQTPSGRGDRGSQSAPLDLGSGSETAILWSKNIDSL